MSNAAATKHFYRRRLRIVAQDLGLYETKQAKTKNNHH